MTNERLAQAIDLAYGYYLWSVKEHPGTCLGCGEAYDNGDLWEEGDLCSCGSEKDLGRLTADEFVERCLSSHGFARRWGVPTSPQDS